ncbi:GNAT family N-acetyltransferase [Streptomyces roseoviridis]|uniref:GNAT family N-acetyltransferase n=1 Tax=Streptomyces roseoviridis TaxID=67361 RepID=UPI0031EE4BB8
MTQHADTLRYRLARPEDHEAIARLDGSFTTDHVYEVTAAEDGFTIRPVPVDPPLLKVFPEDDDEDEEEDGEPGPRRTVVAVDGDTVAGFVTFSFERWNARLTLRDIEVAPAWRGRGVGRALMEHAVGFGRECGAGHAWLEVSNVNAPAVRAYLRWGFAFCGLDTSLYDGTESAGEQALFMARRLG